MIIRRLDKIKQTLQRIPSVAVMGRQLLIINCCILLRTVVFSKDLDDGSYGYYIGYNEKVEICRFLNDFNLLEWNKQ